MSEGLTTVNETEKRVLERIDTEGLIDFLKELTSIPSFGGEETVAQRRVAREFRR